MAGFMYFAADRQKATVDLEDAEKWGLSYAFNSTPESRQVMNGPSGTHGVVFTDHLRQGGRTAGYYPDQQTWREMPEVDGRPALWFGYWNDAKPGPDDLMRPSPLAHDFSIKLADGNLWKVPRIRCYDNDSQRWECAMPSRMDFDKHGNLFAASPLEQHLGLWEMTHGVATLICLGEQTVPPITDRDVQRAAVAILQANYCVDIPELVLLGALSTGAMFAQVVMCACRGDSLLQWISDSKKNDLISDTSG